MRYWRDGCAELVQSPSEAVLRLVESLREQAKSPAPACYHRYRHDLSGVTSPTQGAWLMPLTRRGFLEGLAALTGTALIVRPPTLPSPPQEVVEAELIDDEEVGPFLSCRITRLELFLKSRGIKPAHLARESGYSGQHLLRVRMGRMDPTRGCIREIVKACRRLSREHVRASNLFDLGDR